MHGIVDGIDRLLDILGVLHGLTVWGARINDSGNLFFKLAESPGSGDEWTVRVYSIAWRIEFDGDSFFGIDDAREIPQRVDFLYGQKLRLVTVKPPTMHSIFEFSESRLVVFPVTSVVDRRNWQQWTVGTPHRQFIDIGPGTAWAQRDRNP